MPAASFLPEDTTLAEAWVDVTATPLRGAGVVTASTAETEETLRAAGWFPGRNVSVELWRERLEESGEVRMHEAAKRFLTGFGGLRVWIGGPGITCAKSPFDFDAGFLVGEEGRFAEWSQTIGRDLFPMGELDEGRFFLGIDQNSEVYLVETGSRPSVRPRPRWISSSWVSLRKLSPGHELRDGAPVGSSRASPVGQEQRRPPGLPWGAL